jgi:hypothetical protein
MSVRVFVLAMQDPALVACEQIHENEHFNVVETIVDETPLDEKYLSDMVSTPKH